MIRRETESSRNEESSRLWCPWNIPARALYPSLLSPTLIRISVTSPAPCGFLSRLALLLVTLFPNFVAASPTNCTYELTGSCTKFRKTCPGKRDSLLSSLPPSSPSSFLSRPTREEASMRPTGSSLFSRSGMIYSEGGRRTLGSSQRATCNQVHGLESPASAAVVSVF